MDERKLIYTLSAYFALFSAFASMVMGIGAVLTIVPPSPAPAMIILILGFLAAQFAKIGIPPLFVRMMAKRSPRIAAGLIGLLWFPAMAVCIYASVSFVRSPEFARTFAPQSISSSLHQKEVERGRVKQAMEDGDDEGDMGYEAREMNQRLLATLDAEIKRLRATPTSVAADGHRDQWEIAMGLGAVMLEIFSAAGLVLVGAATPPQPPAPPGSSVTPFSGGSLSSPSSGSSPMPGLPGVTPTAQLAGHQPLLNITSSVVTAPKPKEVTPPSVMADRLIRALADHNIKGGVGAITAGPMVTQYAFRPQRGVKFAKVSELAHDLARELKVTSVAISQESEDGVILFRLPNKQRQIVEIDELFDTPQYQNFTGKLALALGKTISGEPVITDLARAPHLLIAGTTGAGKSVCINGIILSLLQRMSPAELRLILIDPKMGAEFLPYSGIPHLLVPVVIDAKQAIVALRWTVKEMLRRYVRFGETGSRNIDGYNTKMLEPDRLYNIVVVIDEFYDLMLEAKAEVELSVQRLSNMARAAGIHLVMATQRPSVDVITGPIKANLPTRIGLQVGSKVDSRVILDHDDAAALLGNGDLLFKTVGKGLIRAQGPFVSDSRVEQAVESAKSRWSTEYIDLGTDIDLSGDFDEEDSPVFDRGESAERFDVGARRGDKIRLAMEFLEQMLSENGAMLSNLLYELASREEPSIAATTLLDASKRLKVAKTNPTEDGKFKVGQAQLWSLP